MLSEDGIIQDVITEINGEVIEPDFPKFGIKKGIEWAGYNRTVELFGSSSGVDIFIYIDVTKEFEYLHKVGELDDWIEKYFRQIPIMGVEIEFNSPKIPQTKYQQMVSDSRIPRIRVQHQHNEQKSRQPQIGKHSEIFTDLTDTHAIRSDVCSKISTHLNEIQQKSLTEIPHIREFLDSVDSKIYHREEVARAYENGQTGLLVILLSVFFESHLYNEITEKMQEVKENEQAKNIVNNQTRFGELLDYCRYFGVVDENEFRIISSLKNSRNKYAHNLELYHQTQKTQAEQDGTIEEGIELYEDILGSSHTILK